jgi:hypothetical protein
MATTDLRLDEPGTLPRPGPVGRIVRLTFGALCIWYVTELIVITDKVLTTQSSGTACYPDFSLSAMSSISAFRAPGENGRQLPVPVFFSP